MTAPESENVTQPLIAWGQSDEAARDELIPLVYETLRRIARYRLRGERAGHALETAALINEAYLKLVEQSVSWQSRAHLAGVDPQRSRVVELRFFGGLTIEETAQVMGVSTPTVERGWRAARAWL